MKTIYIINRNSRTEIQFNIGGGRKEVNKLEGWTMDQYEEQREKRLEENEQMCGQN